MNIRMIGGILLPAVLLMGCSKDDGDDGSTSPEASGPDLGLQQPVDFVVDDFRSCSPEFKTAVETYWYSFDDEADGGTSISTLQLGAPEAEGGPCSLRWTGQVTSAYEYGYAGMGLDLGSTTLAGYKSITFKVRGDGAAYRVKLPMQSQLADKEYNFHGADMNCGDGSTQWKTVTIDLSALQQEQGWGKAVKLDLADVGKIQLQTKGQPIPAFACEIGALNLVK